MEHHFDQLNTATYTSICLYKTFVTIKWQKALAKVFTKNKWKVFADGFCHNMLTQSLWKFPTIHLTQYIGWQQCIDTKRLLMAFPQYFNTKLLRFDIKNIMFYRQLTISSIVYRIVISFLFNFSHHNTWYNNTTR